MPKVSLTTEPATKENGLIAIQGTLASAEEEICIEGTNMAERLLSRVFDLVWFAL